MKNRGHVPQTDAEMEEDIRDMLPQKQGDRILAAYAQLRAAGVSPKNAAVRAVTNDLNDQRLKLAGLLNRN